MRNFGFFGCIFRGFCVCLVDDQVLKLGSNWVLSEHECKSYHGEKSITLAISTTIVGP